MSAAWSLNIVEARSIGGLTGRRPAPRRVAPAISRVRSEDEGMAAPEGLRIAA
jgi:hypothetical protein